jgi:hypothetical protein
MADEAEKSIGCPDAGAVSLAMIAGCVAATLAKARCPSAVSGLPDSAGLICAFLGNELWHGNARSRFDDGPVMTADIFDSC